MTTQRDSSTGHTPGPWHVQYGSDGHPSGVMNERSETIAVTFKRKKPTGAWNPQEEYANAALMAAAPVLLKVAQAVLEQEDDQSCGCWNGEPTHEPDCPLELARDAIAAAKGGAQ